MERHKVIVVEGKADRLRLQQLLVESVDIICTFGTISEYHLDELLEPYELYDLYVFVDADYTGAQIRDLFHRHYPEAVHLYTDEFYVEVEETPYQVLATQLHPYFEINQRFVNRQDES